MLSARFVLCWALVVALVAGKTTKLEGVDDFESKVMASGDAWLVVRRLSCLFYRAGLSCFLDVHTL